MKNSLIIISLSLFCFFAVIFCYRSNAVAGPEAEQEPSVEELRRGVWQGGKAVFSDIPILSFLWRDERYSQGYKPKQPIQFSHRKHVETNKMECQYCHSGVSKSPFATIPSVELCMGCHKTVKTESPEIKKLAEYFQNKEPVPWVPVNNLPEHAVFNHSRHIKAGVGCHTCHGQVQKMEVVEKVSTLKMGFCVSCHRENGASIDCSICHY